MFIPFINVSTELLIECLLINFLFLSYLVSSDDPEPNSMYSLVRLFDKKKMEYFDENYKQSHLYLSQRKFNKDCLDDGKQLELINKIIDMVSIVPE